MPADEAWSMFRRDPQRTGHAPNPGPTERPTVEWRQTIPTPLSYVIADGTAFLADPAESALRAVDAGTGATRWRHPFDHGEATYLAFDAVARRLLSVSQTGVIDWFTPDGTHRRRLRTGAEPGYHNRDVVISDGTLSVVGFCPPRQVVLSSDTVRTVDDAVWSDGVAADGDSHFLLSGGHVGRYDASSNAFDWTVSLSRPAVEGDAERDPAYVGSAYVGLDGDAVYANVDDALIALDRATGAERWRVPTDAFFPPALAGETVYHRFEGTLVALDTETQTERWRFAASDAPLVAPVLAGDVVYTGEYTADTARLYALDRETGTVIWERDGPEDLYELAVAGGRLFASYGDEFVAFA